MIVVDPGWNTAPQELGGIFLGLDDSGEALRFTAVDGPTPVAYDGCAGTTNSDGTVNPTISGPIVDINERMSPAVDLIVSAHTHNAYNCMLADPAGKGVEAVRPIRDEIEQRVRGLLLDLEVLPAR